jgi:Fe-S cluster assembly iron-binding protein IscA
MGMALDEPEENEKPVRVNGIDVLVAEDDRRFVDGASVDYVKQAGGEGFVITGPGDEC